MPADDGDPAAGRTVLYPEIVVDSRSEEPPPKPKPQRWRIPLLLFIATCLSTLLVGGPVYSVLVMTILLAHELGHYLQARRYGVPASLPHFIPLPLPPIGTLGAIIAMRSNVGSKRALFDLAITGPIAGLIPSLFLLTYGLTKSEVVPAPEEGEFVLRLGQPLIYKLIKSLTLGPTPEGFDLMLHPIAFAGWVGIFITALNMLPIGQLDGGHILYTLLPRRARTVSRVLLWAAGAAILLTRYWHWSLFFLLLLLMGAKHPPARDEDVPLGATRTALGWLMLPFFFLGFSPVPWWF